MRKRVLTGGRRFRRLHKRVKLPDFPYVIPNDHADSCFSRRSGTSMGLVCFYVQCKEF